jgi:hypothetical protein
MTGSGCCLVKFLNRDDRDLLKERCGDWKSLQARSVTKKKMIKEYGRMVLAFLAHMEGFTVGPKGIEEGTSKTKAANLASFCMLSHQPFSFFTISPLLHTDNHWSNPSILYQLGSASDNWGCRISSYVKSLKISSLVSIS